jgi:ketosteroid isomerase-like protein
MSTSHRSEGTSTLWDELPPVIRTYLTAHQAHDADSAIATFTPDAVVTDEGSTHHGREEIRTWLGSAASEYTYTIEFTGAMKTGDVRFDVVQHLEGNFPGGEADLHFRFTLDGPSICRLVIEP